jgi:Zn-dependent protease
MTFIYINVFLGVFNFIPLPPLDGGSILLGILPKSIVPPVSNFLEMHGAVIFFSLLAVNLVFQIPIITGPVLYLSGIIIQLFTLILSPFLINTAGL